MRPANVSGAIKNTQIILMPLRHFVSDPDDFPHKKRKVVPVAAVIGYRDMQVLPRMNGDNRRHRNPLLLKLNLYVLFR
jgi:hypothetical protein